MAVLEKDAQTKYFLKSLGFPDLKIHHSINHYDFTKSNRRILIIGPMGSGKTEFSARIYRDSKIALEKSDEVRSLTTDKGADRRIVFYIRSKIDTKRFEEYPEDALAFRGGYERLGKNIASIDNSFELEQILEKNRNVGTWIVDEAGFFDERIAYVIRNYAEKYSYNFIFPMLILNFRKDIFNRTSRLLMETATDVFPLTAYCEHRGCITDSYYTYRYYEVNGVECPALYFDPLIIVGGDKITADPKIPNYSTRCDAHHYLPGKEYTFLILRSLGELAYSGNIKPILKELKNIKYSMISSEIYGHFQERFVKAEEPQPIMMNSLKVDCIAEKALIYLFAEENVLSLEQMRYLSDEIDADMEYINEKLLENKRFKITGV
ncbi:MAG: thymidine kinase [Spirochaetes bacterium]|nr:thymidine kinase [Spirochaetota bacterium]